MDYLNFSDTNTGFSVSFRLSATFKIFIETKPGKCRLVVNTNLRVLE